jgi:hypothetical protein
MPPLSPQLAAGFGALLLLAIAVFQVLLALGLPLGVAAWGGSHRVLPGRLRVASAVAAPIWLSAALILLERGRVVSLGLDPTLTRVVVWGLTVLLALGTVMNALSRSRRERLIWTPIAATAFVVCLFLALAG